MDEEELISRAASLLAGIDYTRLIGGKTPLETWELEKPNRLDRVCWDTAFVY